MGLIYSLLALIVAPLQRFIWWLGGRRYPWRQLDDLQKKMTESKTYAEWHLAAVTHDRLSGREAWRAVRECSYYDYVLIEKRTEKLREARLTGDIAALILLVRAGLVRGLGGISNGRLYRHCYVGTKRIVEEYVDELCAALHVLVDAPKPDFTPVTKQRFFTDARQAYGRSALLLSGGGSLGLIHFGVVKRLYESSLLPRVISGSSIGALIAGLLGVHLDEELARLFCPYAIDFSAFERLGPGSMRRKVTRLMTQGVLMDMGKLEEFCHDNIGNYTFLEAYHRTHRIINIAVASRRNHEVPWLLNYLTAPNVLIWSAALASCAAPLLYGGVEILAKDSAGRIIKWNASKHTVALGSLDNDLPMPRLAELFNVNHFIVSQVNPHVVPFLALFQAEEGRGTSASRWLQSLREPVLSEAHHIAVQLSRLGPRMFSVFQHMLTQKYVGDITIVPPLALRDYGMFLANPSEELCQRAIQMGERGANRCLTQLKCNLKVELMIDRCVHMVREQEGREPPVHADPLRPAPAPAPRRAGTPTAV